MDWKRALDRYGALIEERLRKYLAGALKDARIYHPFIEKVYSNIEEFVLRRARGLPHVAHSSLTKVILVKLMTRYSTCALELSCTATVS